mmetsp:Transcript_851/g.1608  ORF Transcript_851/g.1608 Transcript_851/m.1608 type:complete len:231 (+) Transcript_851:1414-2106(+)
MLLSTLTEGMLSMRDDWKHCNTTCERNVCLSVRILPSIASSAWPRLTGRWPRLRVDSSVKYTNTDSAFSMDDALSLTLSLISRTSSCAVRWKTDFCTAAVCSKKRADKIALPHVRANDSNRSTSSLLNGRSPFSRDMRITACVYPSSSVMGTNKTHVSPSSFSSLKSMSTSCRALIPSRPIKKSSFTFPLDFVGFPSKNDTSRRSFPLCPSCTMPFATFFILSDICVTAT